MNKPELLLPAGDMEKLKYAVAYGADAVYIGGKEFSLRARPENFGLDEIEEAVKYMHDKGKKIYVAVNIFPQNSDLEKISIYLKNLYDLKIDAVIISDPGIFMLAKKECPNLKIHLSTQANNTNYASAMFWEKQGSDRIVLARELNLTEIKEINNKVPNIDFEIFVHGAMCISYSGRCFLSTYLTGRDANKGDCSHTCRWNYALLEEETRKGEYFYLEEDKYGSMIFNSKDLCMIKHIPQILDTGVSSLKIEGRVKTLYYVSSVARVYRNAIDTYFENKQDFKFNELWEKELDLVNNRGYTTGFYLGEPQACDYKYKDNIKRNTHFYLGKVNKQIDKNRIEVDVKNNINVGDEIEILMPEKLVNIKTVVKNIVKDGEELKRANPREMFEIVLTDEVEVSEWSLVRKIL
jgi:U32 family peptidase